MKLTTKSHYALLAMLDLSLDDNIAPAKLSDIAKRQGISKAYLEQLFNKLRRSGLVESIRGARGGYRLGRNPAQITLAQIITTVDETMEMTRCSGEENCQDDMRCLLHDLWVDLNQHMAGFFNNITLHQLTKQKNIQDIYARQIKHDAEKQFSLNRQ